MKIPKQPTGRQDKPASSGKSPSARLTIAELSALSVLYQAATNPPWQPVCESYPDHAQMDKDVVLCLGRGSLELHYCWKPGTDTFTCVAGNGPTSKTNNILIAAMHKHLPALLAMATALLQAKTPTEGGEPGA